MKQSETTVWIIEITPGKYYRGGLFYTNLEWTFNYEYAKQYYKKKDAKKDFIELRKMYNFARLLELQIRYRLKD